MYLISVPVRVLVTKKKWFTLNLNQYRNAHFYALAKAKREVTDLVRKQLTNIPLLKHVFIVYVVYPRTKHRIDIMNVTSVADKFLCDGLTKDPDYPNFPYILLDDNREIICGTVSFFGAIDADNPRIDAYIIPLENEMKIQLDKVDIKKAVLAFLSDMMGKPIDGDVEFNDQGISIDLEPPVKPQVDPKPAQPVDIAVAQEEQQDSENKSIFG